MRFDAIAVNMVEAPVLDVVLMAAVANGDMAAARTMGVKLALMILVIARAQGGAAGRHCVASSVGKCRLPGGAPRQPSADMRYFLAASLTACLTFATAPFTSPLASSTLPSRSSFLSPARSPAVCLILPFTLSIISPI